MRNLTIILALIGFLAYPFVNVQAQDVISAKELQSYLKKNDGVKKWHAADGKNKIALFFESWLKAASR